MSLRSLIREVLSLARLFAFRGAGVLATFLTSVLIVRKMGAETNGLFQVGVGYVIIAGAVGRVGQDQLNFRRMAGYRAMHDRAAASDALRASLAVSLPFALLSAVGLAVCSIVSGPDDGARYLAAFGWSVLPFAWLWIFTEALRGWQLVGASVFWQGSFVPMAFLTAFAMLNLIGATTPGMLPFLYAACVIVALLGAAASWRSAIRHEAEPAQGVRGLPAESDRATTFRAGKAFWALAILANVAAWIDLLLLYAIADASSVGVFHAIVRTGGLIAVAINIAASGMMAKLALLHASADTDEFARLLRFYWLAITIGAAVACLAFAASTEPVLRLWGPELMPYKFELAAYLLVQFGQALFILAPLIAGVIGLEKQLVLLQIVNVPLKAGTVYIGYAVGGLIGVIAAIGFCTLVTMVWTSVLVVGRLQTFGVSWKRLVRNIS